MNLQILIAPTKPPFRLGSSLSGGDGPTEVSAATLDSTQNLLPGQRVLIVEDNFLVALEFQEVLRQAGYWTDEIAVSAEEAVAMSERTRPHFVLMDVRLLGDADGITAAIEIRGRFGIRSVFVTANDDAVLRARAQTARPFGWIAKPLTGADLITKLQALAATSSSA